MKTLKLLCLCLTLLVFASCAKKSTDKIAGNWTVTNIETSTQLADSTQMELMSGSKMNFTKDGKYTTSGGIGADEGTYTIDKDDKNLTTTSSAGRSNANYEIQKLTENELVLSNNGNTVHLKK